MVNFLETRLINLAAIPGEVLPQLVCQTTSVISGIGFTILSVLTLGKVKTINRFADQVGHLQTMAPNLGAAFIRVLNPAYLGVGNKPEGKCSEIILMPLMGKALYISIKDDFFSRHVVSRLMFSAVIPICIITDLADLALGLLASSLCLLTLGQVNKINDCACHQLSALAMGYHLSLGIRGCLNPHNSSEVDSETRNSLTARLMKLAEIPGEAIPLFLGNLSSVIVGVAFTPLAILTVGRVKTIHHYACLANNVGSLLPHGYSALIKVLNPSYQESGKKFGVVTEKMACPIFRIAKKMVKEESRLANHHVGSRILYLSAIPVALVARTMDLFLSIFGTALSFALLGQVECVNDFAHRQLGFPGMIYDVCGGIRAFINPRPFINVNGD